MVFLKGCSEISQLQRDPKVCEPNKIHSSSGSGRIIYQMKDGAKYLVSFVCEECNCILLIVVIWIRNSDTRQFAAGDSPPPILLSMKMVVITWYHFFSDKGFTRHTYKQLKHAEISNLLFKNFSNAKF